MAKLKRLTVLSFLTIVFFGCWDDQPSKYDRPEWLEGKVYTQVKGEDDLSTFAYCLELTGYDQIVDVSGSYTVFAPTDEAFSRFFQENPSYNSVDNMPVDELSEIVKYHLVQNPWSKVQLRSLDVYGWIDTLDINNNEPKGFKRETLYLNEDIKVGVTVDEVNDVYKVVDTLSTTWKRRIITDSRKYVPFFYKELFDIYDLNSYDYEFYFGRPYESSSDIYFAGAKIIGDEIFAENGFVYKVDKVIQPLRNAYEILTSNESGNDYSTYLGLINYFPDFEYNEEATNDQPGAAQGLLVDSLFDLSYPELTFTINNEKTKPPSGTFGLPTDVTIRYHHGIMAPTNSAMEELFAEYVNGPKYWGNINNTPLHIKRIIVNSYLSINPIFPTDFEEGFYNGEYDKIKLDQSNIIEKEFGSNATFIGLNKAIVPRAFSSVTGPVYLQQGYSYAMFAIEQSGLLPALKREGQNYSLYVEKDLDLRADSSLLYNPVTERFSVIQVTPGGSFQSFSPSASDLRMLILNHVGVELPNGVARKEFIKNMAGNYIIINNETGVVSGTEQTTDGYSGLVAADVIPKKISTNSDNGSTYEITDWFSWSATNLFTRISNSFPDFYSLLVETGLALPREYRFSFISENEFYTVFAPSDEAIANFDFSSYTNEELKNLLLMHFVQGDMIFTDGNKSAGYYETTRIDEKSTPFSTVYSKIYINPEIDEIVIPKTNGENSLVIPESENTNIITGRSISEGSSLFPNMVSNAVVHEINSILLFEELDTK